MHACVSYTCMTLPPILTQIQEATISIKHWKIQVNRTKPGSMAGGYHILYIHVRGRISYGHLSEPIDQLAPGSAAGGRHQLQRRHQRLPKSVARGCGAPCAGAAPALGQRPADPLCRKPRGNPPCERTGVAPFFFVCVCFFFWRGGGFRLGGSVFFGLLSFGLRMAGFGFLVGFFDHKTRGVPSIKTHPCAYFVGGWRGLQHGGLFNGIYRFLPVGCSIKPENKG